MIKWQVKVTGARPCRDSTEGPGSGSWAGIEWTRDLTVGCVGDAPGVSVKASWIRSRLSESTPQKHGFFLWERVPHLAPEAFCRLAGQVFCSPGDTTRLGFGMRTGAPDTVDVGAGRSRVVR